MDLEIEAKFTNIDIDDIRRKLQAVGAICDHSMRNMRRALIEEPYHAAENSFIRIRDEGDKTTLTFKRRLNQDERATIDSTQELETVVGDFETTVKIFSEAGWKYTTFQESRRETWTLNDVEIVIDEWPWLKPYIEIEASSEGAVRQTASLLNLDWSDAIFGSVDVLYLKEFPQMTVRGVIDIHEVRFADSEPAEFGERVIAA